MTGQRGGSVASDLGVIHRALLASAAVLVVVLAIGQATGWTAITRIRPEWPAIYPYTVAGLAALVVAMILFDRGGRTGLIIGRVLAAIPLTLGIVVEPLVSLGVIPSPDPVGGTLSIVTVLPSLAVVATALCVLLLGFPRDRFPRIRFGLGVFAAIVALLGLMSYVYGSASLFHNLGLTGTSMPTTILGLIVIGSAITARPDRPPLESLDDRYDATLLRRMLPPLVVVPFVPALITWAVARVDPDPASVNALGQLITVVILIAILVLAGTGQSRARRIVAMERQRLWEAFTHSPTPTAMLDLDGRIDLANAALARLLEADVDDLVGRSFLDFAAPADFATVAEGLAEIASGLEVVRMDVQLVRTTGSHVWVDAGIAPVRDPDGTPTAILVQSGDLTDRKHLERVLFDQASRDPLTGLLNREGLARQLGQRDTRVPPGQVMAVVYADVDDLKQVNDTIGHSAGDDLLREVARRLLSVLREEDLVARVGGDEFVVVTTVRDVGPDPTAVVVSRLRDELTGPVAVGREIIAMSVSLGAAVVADDMAIAVARADEAMYADKRRRRSTDNA